RMFETAPAPSSVVSPPGPLPAETAIAIPSSPASNPLVDERAPAEMIPELSPGRRLAVYVGAVPLPCALAFFGLRLDRADLRAPFYYDLDALLILPMVKATAQRGPGGHWRNQRRGQGVTAPGRTEFMELYDFPVIDLLHLTLIWMLSKLVANIVLLFNLYFLLTFPLTPLTAMIAFRHLRLTLPAATVGGMLYAFLPYHYQRWENHYFLAAYWLVPLSLIPAFAICRGNFPFFRREPDGTYRRHLRSWGALGYVVLAVAGAAGGGDHAVFSLRP